MTREELEMRTLVRESDVIDRTDGSELAKAFNHLWEKYVEQQPKSEWEHDHEILKAHADGANEVLDKIRAEIEAEPYISKMEVLDIIDKYKAESEDKE